jgi:tryptophanyl-tRNA synthetase
VQQKYKELRSDPAGLLAVLAQGRERANAVAEQSLARVRQALGFLGT